MQFFPTLLMAVLAGTVLAEPVSFRTQIVPWLQLRCAKCHQEDNAKGGYRVDTFEMLSKPGDSGAAALTAGKPRESELFRLLIEEDADTRMPQKAERLPAEEIAMVERWISEGAQFDGDTPQQTLSELARVRHLRAAPVKYPRALPVTALAFSGDGQRLAVSGYRELLIFRTAEGTLAHRIGGLPERIHSAAWSRQGDRIALAGGTPGQWGTVAVVDGESGYRLRFLCDLPEMALSVAVSPDGKQIVAGCADRTVRFFDAKDGRALRVQRLHADWVQAVAYNASGRDVVTAGRDRAARVIDAATGEVELVHQGHEAPLSAAAFFPDGTRAVTAQRGGAMQLWHPGLGGRRGELRDGGGDVRQLLALPSGVAATGTDGLVRLYQPGVATPWMTLAGHRAPVLALAATRDGQWFASGAADGEVIVWDTRCWAPLLRFDARP